MAFCFRRPAVKKMLSTAASCVGAVAMLGAPLAFAQQPAQLPAPFRAAAPTTNGVIAPDLAARARSLIATALQSDLGYEIVRDLTTEIGPRLAGSEAEARARIWAEARFKALGFTNIRTEPFDVPYWSRVVERARITGPNAQPLVIAALGGSEPTPTGGVEAEIVRFASMAALRAADPAKVAGKIVFIDEATTRTQDGSGYGVGVGKRRDCATESQRLGAAACLIRSVGTQHHRFAHQGQQARGQISGGVPAAALSPPDADQIARLLEKGQSVRVNLEIAVEARPAAPSGNVVAEIRGREKPDEIIVIGGHLDSWDSGTGAVDDGAGIGITMAAAKLIADLPQNPRRTIRVVLFGAEETGLHGARAYAERHKAQLAQHIVGAESDFGAGKIWRFDTRFGPESAAKATAIHEILAPLGIARGHNEASGGPDMTFVRAGGVPVVTLQQNGWDYFDLHHTPNDTIDKIKPEDMRQNVAAYAAFVYLVAEMDGDLRK